MSAEKSACRRSPAQWANQARVARQHPSTRGPSRSRRANDRRAAPSGASRTARGAGPEALASGLEEAVDQEPQIAAEHLVRPLAGEDDLDAPGRTPPTGAAGGGRARLPPASPCARAPRDSARRAGGRTGRARSGARAPGSDPASADPASRRTRLVEGERERGERADELPGQAHHGARVDPAAEPGADRHVGAQVEAHGLLELVPQALGPHAERLRGPRRRDDVAVPPVSSQGDAAPLVEQPLARPQPADGNGAGSAGRARSRRRRARPGPARPAPSRHTGARMALMLGPEVEPLDRQGIVERLDSRGGRGPATGVGVRCPRARRRTSRAGVRRSRARAPRRGGRSPRRPRPNGNGARWQSARRGAPRGCRSRRCRPRPRSHPRSPMGCSPVTRSMTARR